MSGGTYTSADKITFTFTLKDGAGSGTTPQLGSTFALADIDKENCDGSSLSSAPHKLICNKNTDKAITVQTKAGAFLDSKANAALASSIFTINSDTTKPTVTITTTDAANAQITNSAYDDTAKITFSFALSDTPASSSSFATDDVTKGNCDNPAFTGSGQAYKLVCDAKDGSAVTAAVAVNKYKDAAGNDNVVSSPGTFTVNSDTTAPTVTITSTDQAAGSITSGADNDATVITFTFTLNEVPVPGTLPSSFARELRGLYFLNCANLSDASFTESDITKAHCTSPTTASTFKAVNINKKGAR